MLKTYAKLVLCGFSSAILSGWILLSADLLLAGGRDIVNLNRALISVPLILVLITLVPNLLGSALAVLFVVGKGQQSATLAPPTQTEIQ